MRFLCGLKDVDMNLDIDYYTLKATKITPVRVSIHDFLHFKIQIMVGKF